MTSRYATTLVLAGMLGFGLAADAAAQSATTTIKIGAVVDQTGGSTSPLYRAAIELAGKQMNEALAKAKSPLRFDIAFGDSKSNPPFAQGEALRLINENGVKALVTDSSGVSVAVNRLNYDPASKAKGKVAITCFQCSSSFINDPNVTESDPQVQAAERDADNWLYRVFYLAKYEAGALIQIALKKIDRKSGPVRIAIFADVGHRALVADIVRLMPSFRKDVAIETVYMTAIDKLGDEWGKVIDDKDESGKTVGAPDLVIVAMLPDPAAQAIRIYREKGYKIAILSNNSFRRNYILKGLGAAANGLEGSSVTQVDKGPSGKAFLKAFKAATGEAPEMTSSGAYDSAVTLMLAALQAAGGGKAEVGASGIRAGLARINDPKGKTIRPTVADFAAAAKALAAGKPINYEGAYHALDWDAVGDMFPPMVHWKVENAQFKEYELYRCTPKEPTCLGGK